jgi:hypothetical protein
MKSLKEMGKIKLTNNSTNRWIVFFIIVFVLMIRHEYFQARNGDYSVVAVLLVCFIYLLYTFNKRGAFSYDSESVYLSSIFLTKQIPISNINKISWTFWNMGASMILKWGYCLRYEEENGKSNYFVFYLSESKEDKKELRSFLDLLRKTNPMVKINIDPSDYN